jgi:hypothetical protein
MDANVWRDPAPRSMPRVMDAERCLPLTPERLLARGFLWNATGSYWIANVVAWIGSGSKLVVVSESTSAWEHLSPESAGAWSVWSLDSDHPGVDVRTMGELEVAEQALVHTFWEPRRD